MAEESDTSGEGGAGRPGPPSSPGGGRRSEGDLLSERRALRAAESGEAALIRRAEAAEATVHTLERHVLSLQARLGEAEAEALRLAEVLAAERTVTVEREHELRRVKQREYAEQQLRVEAEDRLTQFDREGRADVQELASHLAARDHDVRELATRLEGLQRQLAEAEQAAAAQRAALQRAESELHARLSALEARAAELEHGLAEERALRERSELELELMRRGHRQIELVVGEIKHLIARLAGALSASTQAPPPAPAAQPASVSGTAPAPAPPPTTTVAGAPAPHAAMPPARPYASTSAEPLQQRGQEMADALAVAVERLRARAENVPAAAPQSPPETRPEPVERVPHKHSMSLIGRIRFRRKQRRMP